MGGGRWFMLALAMLYNLFFIGTLTDFLLLLYVYDKSEYGFGYVMESMFFGYNLVIHFPIAILNTVVILKEFSLEFLQMSQKRNGHNDHLALGIAEFLEVFNDAK